MLNKMLIRSFHILAVTVPPSAMGLESSQPRSVTFTPSGWRGMVAADDPQAAQWGTEILKRGGNAVDAAVATAFGMAVTRPHYAALGGGGFMVHCPAPQNGLASECTVLDFREKAPMTAKKDMYIRNGKADTTLSQQGALASGTPGVPAGLLAALSQFGSRKVNQVLSDPIQWAKQGVRVSAHTETALSMSWTSFNAEARKIFSCQNKTETPCKAGDVLIQSDLAKTLSLISKKGHEGFYKGITAKRIAAAMKLDGGLISEADLTSYKPQTRKPIVGKFRNYEVITMPPPSSGGILLVQLLKYFEFAQKSSHVDESPISWRTHHSKTHAMSLAFSDRTTHLGDADFYPVPSDKLLSEKYLSERWMSFRPDKAALPTAPGEPIKEPDQTTHLSVIDSAGNAVAMTLTVNGYFGSGYVPKGTGIVMNNEMDDFALQPGVPNMFGLVGSEANSIAPSKRPLSSMTPTIVRDDGGNARIALGAAGGPRIITSVYQTIINRLHFGMSLTDSVAAPRIHHQWKPRQLFFEMNRFAPDVISKLKEMGYELSEKEGLAVVHAVERSPNGQVFGAADPRGEGVAVAQ